MTFVWRFWSEDKTNDASSQQTIEAPSLTALIAKNKAVLDAAKFEWVLFQQNDTMLVPVYWNYENKTQPKVQS